MGPSRAIGMVLCAVSESSVEGTAQSWYLGVDVGYGRALFNTDYHVNEYPMNEGLDHATYAIRNGAHSRVGKVTKMKVADIVSGDLYAVC